jgi:oxygen-independent coproporphyrinogen-3 oxidase
VLSQNQLSDLLCALDINNCAGQVPIEFTFEAGRPETITKEKLSILKDGGVNRISINPQTFNDFTLEKMRRSHSAAQTHSALLLAKKYNFDINMDLIAGFECENTTDFVHSLSKTVEYSPENITIHTLSYKNGSKLFEKEKEINPHVESMMDTAYSFLKEKNYFPYYLYRQKNMAKNLENTGFCLQNKESINNITTMEETLSVYACGAGAISKKVEKDVITRHSSLRDVKLYLEQFEERLQKKLQFFG